MSYQRGRIAEIDAYGGQPATSPFVELLSGNVVAIRVRNLVSTDACQHVSGGLLKSDAIADHADVKGLRVLGLSHFQAARDSVLAERYFLESRSQASRLRRLASPFASPFDSAMGFLAQNWSAGCRLMELPTEGQLAPFTIRIYLDGVEIEPHHDLLSAESPSDAVANSLTEQFGANIYLSMGSSGGALEIFDVNDRATGYKDLSDGPKVVARSDLRSPAASIVPSIGDLIIFPSRRVHCVTATRGPSPRITISFFIGVLSVQAQLRVWA